MVEVRPDEVLSKSWVGHFEWSNGLTFMISDAISMGPTPNMRYELSEV